MSDTHVLNERLRRTRAVCLAIERAGGDVSSDPVAAAAHELWAWLDARYPREMGSATRGGLETTHVPPGGQELIRELYAATSVCDGLAVYYSADTFAQMDRDADSVADDLARWRKIADARTRSDPRQ